MTLGSHFWIHFARISSSEPQKQNLYPKAKLSRLVCHLFLGGLRWKGSLHYLVSQTPGIKPETGAKIKKSWK
eukprot:6096669-Amphidinium_carterae.1